MSSTPQKPETTTLDPEPQPERAGDGGSNRPWLKIGGIGCAGILGLCLLLGVIATVAGFGDDDNESDEDIAAVTATATATENEDEATESTDPSPTPEASDDPSPTPTDEPDVTNTPAEATSTPVPPTATDPPTATLTPAPPTATPEPSPTPTPSAFTFGEGVKIVGENVPPGIYRSTGPGGGLFDSCYWERLSGFGGTLDEIVANEFADYRQVVEIKGSDAGFNSEGCGEWTDDLSPITAEPTAPFGDGVWIVGVDIAPGTWQSETPPDGSCYWERMSGFGGELDDIIANEFTESQQVVTIQPGDVGFKSDGCGTWTLVS